MVAKMRLHEITEDKLNEFAPLAGLAGLARIVGPAVLRGAGGAALRGIAGLGIRGAGMLSSLLSSEPKAQVAYNNMQGADTEEEQKRWAEEIDRQFKEFYQNQQNEGKSPHPKGSKKYEAHMAAMHAGMNERKLTNKEEGNVEHNVKKLKPHKKNFTDQYGKDGESVMYAVATRDAKKGKSYS